VVYVHYSLENLMEQLRNHMGSDAAALAVKLARAELQIKKLEDLLKKKGINPLMKCR